LFGYDCHLSVPPTVLQFMHKGSRTVMFTSRFASIAMTTAANHGS
jgi:hypothetical protein